MEPKILFFLVAAVIFLIVTILNVKYGMLRDISVANKKPYSFARLQFTWWVIIIAASFTAIVFSFGQLPEVHQSTLLLLGLSATTLTTSRLIDASDALKTAAGNANDLSRNAEGQGMLLDILSDNAGVSIHRFQALLFNLIFGGWFVVCILKAIDNPGVDINSILPDLTQNNLILLGLSSATYAAVKTSENK